MKHLLYRLSVQAKMIFVLLIGLVGFTVYFSVNQIILKSHSASMSKIVHEKLPALELTDEITNKISILRDSTTQAVLSQNFEAIGQADRAHKAILDSFKSWTEKGLPHQELSEKLRGEYVAAYNQQNEMIQNIVAGINSLAEVKEQYKNSVAKMVAVEGQMKRLKMTINNDLQQVVAETESLGFTARWIGIGTLVVALVGSCFFFWIVVGITRSLALTNEALQSTSKRLLEMVGEAQVSAMRLRDTAFRQTSSSAVTVISMEHMKRLLAQTSQTSVNAVQLSEASFSEANVGKGVVQDLRDAMSQIERSNTELEEVNQVVKLIRERTNVINEIVFKTQMLSFNANIEAARAGQHGLGFAVVANEMGNLAEMSGKAAQQINELLDRSANKVGTTVSRTKEKIEKGHEMSASCYEFFKLLTDRSGQLKEFVNSISSSANEQHSGVEDVVKAMNELNSTAAESDRMAQGISRLADGLKTQAVGLAFAVDSLNELVEGRKGDGPTQAPPDERPPLQIVKESA